MVMDQANVFLETRNEHEALNLHTPDLQSVEALAKDPFSGRLVARTMIGTESQHDEAIRIKCKNIKRDKFKFRNNALRR